MHAASGDAENRFGHKSRVQAVLVRDCFYGQFECHNAVCRFQSAAVFKVNLMLTGCAFVVRGFYFKPHLFQIQYDIAPHVFARIYGTDVEVARVVEGF